MPAENPWSPVAESGDDARINPSTQPTLTDVAAARLSRRGVLKGMAAVAATTAVPGVSAPWAPAAAARESSSTLTFEEVPQILDRTHHVAPGYRAEVLIRWGDEIMTDAPAFDPYAQTPGKQARQFGYNCDFIAYFPLPAGSGNPEHGLLAVNHEYTDPHLMFPGFAAGVWRKMITREQVEVEMAAHGMSIVEIRKENGRWRVVGGGPYNRRITANGTEMILSGPVAGHARVRTSADPSGRRVLGTLNNCAGGVTPWGTVLTAEENFHFYFGGDPAKTPEARNHARLGIKPAYTWHEHHDRFHVEREPNEPNRFGWIVEVDPYDPASTPVKRTALGRFKHENAAVVVNPDGRIVVYSGDDQVGEYVYRFVSNGRFDPAKGLTNGGLLDDGTLSVARFLPDGTVRWLPLVFGREPLTPANGFESQADVLIDTRLAADRSGATPMDRPEDVEADPTTGRVYVALTKNKDRKADRTDAANPRAENLHGHILELIPAKGDGGAPDHAADVFRWDVFILAGDPADAAHGARYGGAGVSERGWFANPDNLAFDPRGRLWIATDGLSDGGTADGLWGCDTSGPGRAVTRRLFASPTGAETCGPYFTPDGRTLFLSVQHPGEDKGSAFDTPSTRWPDFAEGMPPRPAVVVITREDGGEIGG